MPTLNSYKVINNELYMDIIRRIFFLPDIFITESYIKETIFNMENKLLDDDFKLEEFIYIKFIIGLCIYKSNNYDSANILFETLIYSNDLKDNSSITAYLYTILSISYLKANNISKHCKYHDLAINYLESKGLKELLLYLYLNTSLTKLEYYNTNEILHNTNELFNNIDTSFKILTEYDGIYSSHPLIIIGYIYYKYLKLNTTAINIFKRVLSIAKSNSEINITILANYYIGCAYLRSEKITKGIDTLKNILKNYIKLLPAVFKLKIYSKILEHLFKLNYSFYESKKLIVLYEKELLNLDNYYLDIYLSRYNLIVVHYKILEINSSTNKRDLYKLFYYLDNATSIYKNNSSKHSFSNFEYWLEISYGNLYFSLSNYEQALMHHEKALLFSKNSTYEYNINLYKLISNDYENLSNYKEALRYYKTYMESLDKFNTFNSSDLYAMLFEEYNKKIVLNSVNKTFFSNLSHELKTPVNIIYSSVQLMSLLKDKDQHSLKDYFNKYEKSVKQNCLRMIRLINNLIDITKIDSGMVKLDLVTVDIVTFIEDLTLSIVPYTKYKNLTITFDTNVENFCLNIDTDAFERILLNLLSNAIKFTKVNGSIIVSIDASQDEVIISIKDTGIGISEEFKDLIFNRFYKIDNSFSRKTEGSGIGLAITKNLIELHGGKISINENYKDGSEFVITFPSILQKDISKDTKFKYYVDDEKILSELSDIYDLF